MTTNDDVIVERLARTLDEHGPELDREGDYKGACWCGWSQPDWAGFHRSPNNWREHLVQALLPTVRELQAEALMDFRKGLGRRFWFQDPYGHFDSATVSAFHRQVEGMLDAEVERLTYRSPEETTRAGE